MSLVFAGICSHAPGITSRADQADPALRDGFYAAYGRMREALEAARPDALIVVAAEHFANFFMNNMPAYAMGMADAYEGPIEEPDWLKISRTRIPGDADLSRRLIQRIMVDVDVAFAEEWKFDHGVMVPLHFLTPRYDLKIIPANINCQGPPLTPDSGRINEAWDRDFLDRWARNDRAALMDYTDAATYAEAGQGGFEIRTMIAVAAAARGAGEVWFYAPIPIFAVGCTVGVMKLDS